MSALAATLKDAERVKKLKSLIPKLIEISGFRNDFIAKKIGMIPSHFSLKKKKGNWNEKELKKLVDVITLNEDVEDYFLAAAVKDVDFGKTVPLKPLLKKLRS